MSEAEKVWPEIPDSVDDKYGWEEWDWEYAWVGEVALPDGATVRAGFIDNPEGYASLDYCLIVDFPDGRVATMAGWADTTGWGCQDEAEVKVHANYGDAVRWGLTDEQRRRLGIDQPEEPVS